MSIINNIASFAHMLRLPKPEYEIYCREKRLERYEKDGGQVRYLRLHALAHRTMIPLMKTGLYLVGKRLTVLQDDRKPTKRPIIYCPTHIGGADVEMCFLAIRKPCWLALGDPRELYKHLYGFVLQMNGLIVMDTMEQSDRTVAKAQMKALLKKGGNLLLYPEGAYNITPNALLLPLYAGAVDLAITCEAEIVPIAVERNANRYYVMLGNNISYSGCTYEERFTLTEELRNKMASLKWEIIEQLPALRHSDISDTTYDDYIRQALVMPKTYTCEDIQNAKLHPKGLTEPTEAFAFMDKLIPCWGNAFLFDKRRSGLPFG